MTYWQIFMAVCALINLWALIDTFKDRDPWWMKLIFFIGFTGGAHGALT